jgi:hypothetical protein
MIFNSRAPGPGDAQRASSALFQGSRSLPAPSDGWGIPASASVGERPDNAAPGGAEKSRNMANMWKECFFL